MDTRTPQISPKNYSNEQTQKRSKFIRNINTKEIIKFVLGSGFIFSLIGLMVNCIAEKAQKQMIMTDYIKDMSNLIIAENIYRSEVGLDDLDKEKINQTEKNVINKDLNELDLINLEKKNAKKKHEQKQLMARALTLSTLRRFGNDSDLKGQVIQFLYESELIGFCKSQDEITDPSILKCSKPIIILGYANLNKANVRDVIPLLNGLDLKNTHLTGANFNGTSLLFANFESARLNKAHFSRALLGRSNFKSAYLKEADFSESDLYNANFEDACLLGTNFSEAQGINEAKFKGAFYDQETTKFPPEFKIENSMMIKWTPAMKYCK